MFVGLRLAGLCLENAPAAPFRLHLYIVTKKKERIQTEPQIQRPTLPKPPNTSESAYQRRLHHDELFSGKTPFQGQIRVVGCHPRLESDKGPNAWT